MCQRKVSHLYINSSNMFRFQMTLSCLNSALIGLRCGSGLLICKHLKLTSAVGGVYMRSPQQNRNKSRVSLALFKDKDGLLTSTEITAYVKGEHRFDLAED